MVRDCDLNTRRIRTWKKLITQKKLAQPFTLKKIEPEIAQCLGDYGCTAILRKGTGTVVHDGPWHGQVAVCLESGIRVSSVSNLSTLSGNDSVGVWSWYNTINTCIYMYDIYIWLYMINIYIYDTYIYDISIYDIYVYDRYIYIIIHRTPWVVLVLRPSFCRGHLKTYPLRPL